MIQNNMVMVGLTISMHFQQFEELKFLIFSGRACPRTPLNPSRVSNGPDLGGIAMILLETRLQSGHKYPDFEANCREVYFCEIIIIFVTR